MKESCKPILISDNLYFVGVFDEEIRTFDIIMKTANGSSYNAFLLKTSQGVILLDTVKEGFEDQYFKNIESLCKYEDIKYVVIHHLEPDHSGALPELIQRAPQAKVVISAQAQLMLKALVQSEDIDFEMMWTGKSLTLGEKTLEFLSTPYLHWPETMSSYLVENKTLFSGDVFGSHFYDKRLFNTKVGDFDYAFKYYYDHIMRPFKKYVLNALKLYDSKDIELIAPLHGPILKNNIEKYINLYQEWSSNNKYKDVTHGKKVISIFYLTSYKNTREMAKMIYEGCESVEGIVANIYDLASIEPENTINLLEESDGILLGTPTINADAPKPIWDLLSYMMLLEKSSKTGGAFGSYGWSGEAPRMIIERMKSLKFRVPPIGPMTIKLVPTYAELQECYDFGQEFAKILNGKMVEITLD